MQADLTQMKYYELGQYGATVVTDTDPISGDYWAVLALSDTVFATGTTFNGDTNPFGATSVSAGVQIPGNFTDIELVSGAVVAFKFRAS